VRVCAAASNDLTTAVHNWHDEIFACFEQPITNAHSESSSPQFVAQE
jgi:hypothetical protein